MLPEIFDMIRDKISNSKIVNNLTTTTTGSVLDASQGKILNDNIIDININKPVNFRSESNLPNDYPNNMMVCFHTTETFAGFNSANVRTYVRHGSMGLQEVYRADGTPIKFRLAVGGTASWGAWQTYATVEQTVRIRQESFNGLNIDTITNSIEGYCVNCTNTPGGSNGYLKVEPVHVDIGYIKQTYTVVTNGKTFIRVKNGTWGTWIEFTTETKTPISVTPSTGYTIIGDNSFKFGPIYFININVTHSSGSIPTSTFVSIGTLPFKPKLYAALSFYGHDSGGSPKGQGNAGVFYDSPSIYVSNVSAGVSRAFITGIIIL